MPQDAVPPDGAASGRANPTSMRPSADAFTCVRVTSGSSRRGAEVRQVERGKARRRQSTIGIAEVLTCFLTRIEAP